MTIICAITDGKKCFIGSDTQSVGGGVLMDCGPKWIVQGGWAVGVAGDQRLADIIRADDILRDLETPWQFTERLRASYKEYDVAPAERRDGGAPSYNSLYLLATPHRVWEVYECLAVTPVRDGKLWALGSGAQCALGAGYAMKRRQPKQIVTMAVEAAIEICSRCGGDVWVECLK